MPALQSSFFGIVFGQLFNARAFTRAFPLERLPTAITRGDHIVITGGSSGLGKELALVVCEQKAFGSVTLVGRNVDRLEGVAEQCRSSYPEVEVQCHVCDLTELDQVHALCDKLSETSVDVLVNNAGALCHSRELNSEGLESTFATHVLAPWVFTNRLQPDKTIHNLSGGLLTQKMNLDQIRSNFDGPDFDGTRVYAQCKRALLEASQCRTTGSYNRAISSHPGWVDTPGVDSLFEAHPEYKAVPFRPVRDGCLGLFVLAVTSLSELHLGGFYFDGVLTNSHCWLAGTQSTDEERQELCDYLDSVSGLDGTIEKEKPIIH